MSFPHSSDFPGKPIVKCQPHYKIVTDELPSLIRFLPRDVPTWLVVNGSASLVDGRHNVWKAKVVGWYNVQQTKFVG